MRAALYARVSTDEQVEGYSIDAQLRAGRDLAHQRGWVIVEEYVDEGKSARVEDIDKRPKFKEMLKAARDKQFDVLIVHKLDRFARNVIVTLKSFEELWENGITFISITEQMDFTTPIGKVFLATVGAFAQFYSDNLSQETKKGWAERREQGLYCGTLPFGAMKGEDGIPIPDTAESKVKINGQEISVCNYEGLKQAFKLAVQDKSDREVAVSLNASGYRTTGTHGPRPFSKDTIKNMLRNRFYIGYIPDGSGGWLKAKHAPFIDLEVFEGVQKFRERRATSRFSVRSDASIYSLSGLVRCAECVNTLRAFKGSGRVRLVCNGRLKGGDCTQPSTALDVYERQLMAYLGAFQIPPDYQEKILEAHRKLQSTYDSDKQKALLEARLKRIKDLYGWGHVTRKEYLTDYTAIRRDLQQVTPIQPKVNVLERLAAFLKDIVLAWKDASQEQRNRLAKCLFEVVWIKDKKVVAVTPRLEFKPFFELQYDGKSRYILQVRPRGDLNP